MHMHMMAFAAHTICVAKNSAWCIYRRWCLLQLEGRIKQVSLSLKLVTSKRYSFVPGLGEGGGGSRGLVKRLAVLLYLNHTVT